MSHVYWRYRLESELNDDWRVCYGIIVASISLILFGTLVSFMPVLRAGLIAISFVFFFICVGFCVTSTNIPQEANHRSPHHRFQTAYLPGRLGPSAFSAIPGFIYGSSTHCCEKEESFRACSVCLEKLEEGEIVRQMPSCNHVFHAGCIDMWLSSHITCPLCRSSVEPLSKVTKESSDSAIPPV